MRGDLSHGLPWLYAYGNQIRRADSDTPMFLTGVNRSGLEYSAPRAVGYLQSAALSRREIEEITAGWSCNVIRLPFNQDWVLRGRDGHPAEAYCDALDQVIDWAASLGAYTVLDLHWLSVDCVYGHLNDGSENYVPPLPNPESIEAWSLLAQRYRHEPAVLFDLLNEPHDRLPDDPNPLWCVAGDGSIVERDEDRVGWDRWTPWAEKLIDTIHSIHPAAPVLVSGVNWGYDLRGVRIRGPNVIYAAHVYPDRPRWEWRDRFGFAGLESPLFIAEWGGGDGDVEWGARLLRFMQGRTCGWTAWGWFDRPRLVENARAGVYRPTKFGELVKGAMKAVFAV